MCAKFRENHRKTVGVVIWKKFDDIQTDSKQMSHLYYKLCWLQASRAAKKNMQYINI